MLNFEKIAQTIMALRDVNNLSQRAFAESLGLVSKHYVIAIEKMTIKDINPIFLEKVRDVYDIDLTSNEYKVSPFADVDSKIIALAKECSTRLSSPTRVYLSKVMEELLKQEGYIEVS